MAYGTPANPVSGTVITVAYAATNILDPIRWLRLMTGNADPPGTAYVAISDSVSAVSWKKVPTDAIADNAVTTPKLLDGAVTAPKLAPGVGLANLGYTPVNRAGDTGITGPLGITTSPGSGQSLTGLTVLNASGGASSALVKFVAGGLASWIGAINGVSSFVVLDPTGGAIIMGLNAAGQLEVAGQLVWNRGNDGSGSGLDADLFDGLDSPAFVLKAGSTMTGDLQLSNVFLRCLTGGKGIVFSGGGQVRDDGTASTSIYSNGDMLLVFVEDGSIELLRVSQTQFLYRSNTVFTTANIGGASVGFATTAGSVSPLSVTDAGIAAANKDGAAATPSMRTIGIGALQAAPGNHGHASMGHVANGSYVGNGAGIRSIVTGLPFAPSNVHFQLSSSGGSVNNGYAFMANNAKATLFAVGGGITDGNTGGMNPDGFTVPAPLNVNAITYAWTAVG